MNPYHQLHPCGAPLPLNNPHACSVSMPTIQDVIDYEEQKNGIFERIRSAYPRIIFHPYVVQLTDLFKRELRLSADMHCFLIPDLRKAEQLKTMVIVPPELHSIDQYCLAAFEPDQHKSAEQWYQMMKHTGIMIYSREAADALRRHGRSLPIWIEKTDNLGGEEAVKSVLSHGYNTSRSRIQVTSSGMNSIYSGYKAVKTLQESQNRSIVIQFGWLYADTIQLLKKTAETFIQIFDTAELKELETCLEERGHKVAMVITETVSNPLISSPDLPELSTLCRRYKVPLLVDNTFSTPWNCNAALWCDLVFESLTKFACGKGDNMAGAVILPENTCLPDTILKDAARYQLPCYNRNLNRLAWEINDYSTRIKQINCNTQIIAEYLENHPSVEELFHVFKGENRSRYLKSSAGSECWGGVISVVFNLDFHQIYNALRLPKGPSLGTDFTLVMPYTMLAHYDLVTSPKGKKELERINLSPRLLRFSIGLEDPQEIIRMIEEAIATVLHQVQTTQI